MTKLVLTLTAVDGAIFPVKTNMLNHETITTGLGYTYRECESHLYYTWDVPYTPGTLQAVGYAAVLALCVVSLVSDTYNPFLYFRF